MTRDDAKKIIMIIASAYPNFKPLDLSNTVDTWHLLLSDYTYEQISVALKAYILSDTSGFAPSVGQLIEKVHTIHNSGTELNGLEAWGLVSKALRNGTYGAEEEFNKLPEIVQKAVGSPSQLRNWATTDSNSIENVIQSNFLRTYSSVCSREKEFVKMPSEIRNMITQNTETKMIDTKENNDIKQIDIREYEGVPMPDSIKQQIELMKKGE